MLFELDSLRNDQQKQIEQLKKELAVRQHQLEKEKIIMKMKSQKEFSRKETTKDRFKNQFFVIII